MIKQNITSYIDLLADYFKIWDAFLKGVSKVSLKCFAKEFDYLSILEVDWLWYLVFF